MREILFRGKRVDNGAWGTGSFVGIRIGCSDEQTYIADKMTGYNTPVIPETVGQYTGMKDKNGRRIFEGDIIRFTHFMVSDRLYVVEWNQESAMFHLKCSGCDSKYEQEAFDTNFEYTSREHFEIVGNIHDNPELLESAGKDAAPYADQPVLMNAT